MTTSRVYRRLIFICTLFVAALSALSAPHGAFGQDRLRTGSGCYIENGELAGTLLALPFQAQVGNRCSDGAQNWGRVVSLPQLDPNVNRGYVCEILAGVYAGRAFAFPYLLPLGQPCTDGRGFDGQIVSRYVTPATPEPTPTPTPQPTPTPIAAEQYSSLCSISYGPANGFTLDYAPNVFAMIGSVCGDDSGNSGVIIIGPSNGNSIWCQTSSALSSTSLAVAIGTRCVDPNGDSGVAVPAPAQNNN